MCSSALGSHRGVFRHFTAVVPLRRRVGQADARCSRSAAPRRRLVRRVVFFQLQGAARAAQPSEHEDLLGNRFCLILAVAMTHLAQSHSLVHLPCCDVHCFSLLFTAFLVVFQCFWYIHSRSTRLAARDTVSVSLPRIWLSRSTSETDALGDDKTQLRLTASQTATTRGVMVSGIMGGLDMALRVRDGICVDPPLCRGTSQGKYGSCTKDLVWVGRVRQGMRHDTWMTIVLGVQS